MTNPREQFKKVLLNLGKDPFSEENSIQLFSLPLEITPQKLYRYRSCNEYSFADLEQKRISFSAPSTFNDDTNDALLLISKDYFEQIKKEAAGHMLPVFNSILAQPTFREKSIEASKVISPGPENIVSENLFEGFVLSNNKSEIEQITEISGSELENIIDSFFKGISSCNMPNALRRITKVACLCENPNSSYMWKAYAQNETGFQIAYERTEIFTIQSNSNGDTLIYPVLYESIRPQMNITAMFLFLMQMGFDFTNGSPVILRKITSLLLEALYIKDRNKYSKEHEWRLLLLDQNEPEHNALYTSRKCIPSYIRLGRKISPSDEQAIRAITSNQNITVFYFDEEPM